MQQLRIPAEKASKALALLELDKKLEAKTFCENFELIGGSGHSQNLQGCALKKEVQTLVEMHMTELAAQLGRIGTSLLRQRPAILHAQHAAYTTFPAVPRAGRRRVGMRTSG